MVMFHFKLGHVFTSPNGEFTPGELEIHAIFTTSVGLFTSEIGAFTPKNRDTSKMDLFSINWDLNQLRTMFFDLVCVVTRVKLGSCG